MGAWAGFVFGDPTIWGPLYLEVPYRNGDILTIQLSPSNQGPVIVLLMSTYLLPHILHKVQPIRLTVGFIEGEGEGVIYLFYF